MKENERNFLNDVLDALDDWNFSYETYHDNGTFCIDVTIDDIDEWAENSDEIWDALDSVSDKWGCDLDSDTNEYYLAIDFD